jgi:rhomboid protease GluP
VNQYAPREPVTEAVNTRLRVEPAAPVPYVTYAIVGITVVIYLLQLASVALVGYASGLAHMDVLMAWGARINPLILQGQVWRFLTPVLLHASIPHILFNMYALAVFGAGLEKHFGHIRFLALYVLGGFAGNVLSFLLSDGYSVGASTAVFALVGAEGVFLYQNRGMLGNQFAKAIGNVLFIVAVNLALGLTPGIDNWGHVGGLLGGVVFTWFAGPIWEVRPSGLAGTGYELVDRREARDAMVGAAAVLLIFGTLAVYGMLTGG